MLDEQQKKLVIEIAQTIYVNTMKASHDTEYIKRFKNNYELCAKNSFIIAEAFVKSIDDYKTLND